MNTDFMLGFLAGAFGSPVAYLFGFRHGGKYILRQIKPSVDMLWAASAGLRASNKEQGSQAVKAPGP